MWKFIILALAAFILYKLLMGDRRQKQQSQVKEQARMAASGEMVRDPVCGVYVPSKSDIRVKDGEKVHCFCSYECRDSYLKRLQGGQIENQSQD